jgi:MFS family permease
VTVEDSGALRLLRDREFAALAGTAFARSQAYSTVLIALALYAGKFDASGTMEGLFGTGFALVQLFLVLPLGRKVDTGNAKTFLLVGLCLNVAVFVGFTLVDSAVHVVLVRVLQGFGASILWLTGSTVVGEISPDDASGRWLGGYNQVAAFSSLFGDLVGGYLLYAHGFTLTYAVLSAVTIGAFVLVYVALRDNPGGRTDPEEATSVETFRDLLDRPMVRALVTFRLGFAAGKMVVIIFLPIFAYRQFGITAFAIGWILAGGKLTKSLLQGYTGDVTDRVDDKRALIVAGALLFAVGTAIIPAAALAEGTLPRVTVDLHGNSQTLGGAFLVLFLAYAVIGVGDSLRLPASMSMFVEEGERFDSVASSLSLRSFAWKIGQVGGPLAAGVLKDFVSAAAAFFAAAAVIVVATAAFLVSYSWAADTGPVDPAPGD